MFGSPNDMKRSNTPSLLDPYYRLRVKGMQRHNSGGEQFPLITHHKVRIMRNRVSGHIGRDTPGVSGCSAHDFASLKIHARRCHNRLLVKGCEYISRILFVFLVDFFCFSCFVAGAVLCGPCKAHFVAGAGPCGPWSAEFVAGAGLFVGLEVQISWQV